MGNITKQLLVTLDYTNIIMLYEFGDDVTIEEIVEKCKSGTHLSWLSSTIHVPPILRLKADLECIKLISHLIVDERLIDSLKIAESYAEGQATEEEFEKAKAIAKQAAHKELDHQLSKVLADGYAFYFKTHAFHWNIEGSDFPQYHTFYDTLYGDVSDTIDKLAEYIRILGH